MSSSGSVAMGVGATGLPTSVVKSRRVLAGSTDDRSCWTPLTKASISDLSSHQYAISEYIRSSITADPSAITSIITCPSPDWDQDVWQYEHIRAIICSLNVWVSQLSSDCTASSCHVMSATADWEFLCAAHFKQPVKCAAIDYAMHTLSSFTALIHNNQTFPNRVFLNPSVLTGLNGVVRRLYRLFAHTYFHHREIYEKMENETYLTKRFVAFSLMYHFMDHTQFTPVIPQTQTST